jgi:hypothetical protein
MTDAVSRPRYCPTRCINVDDASMGIRILTNICRFNPSLGTIETYGYFIAHGYMNPIRTLFRYSDIYKGSD